MLAAIGTYGQNKFKYQVQALGGLSIGNTADTAKIDSIIKSGTAIKFYRGSKLLDPAPLKADTTSQEFTGTVTAANVAATTLKIGSGGNTFPADSLTSDGTVFKLYDGATQLAPDIPDSGEGELGDYAYLLGDTLYSQNPAIYTQRQVDSLAALKANIASPTFTGTPAAPTAAVGTNTTQIATTAFVLANRGYDEWDALYDSLNSDIITQSLGVSVVDANTLSSDLTDGTAYYQAVYIGEPCTVTGIKFMSADNGSFMQDNYNEVALYSFANDTIYQIAVSANDSTKWETASGGVIDFPFTTPEVITAPGIYYVGFIFNASAITTNPELVSITNTIGAVLKVGFSQSGQTELADKKRVSTGTNVVVLWWFALYYTP